MDDPFVEANHRLVCPFANGGASSRQGRSGGRHRVGQRGAQTAFGVRDGAWREARDGVPKLPLRGAVTKPDFLEKRYCRECRDWLAVVSMVAAILFHIAFPLSSGWIVLHGVFGIEKWSCLVLICSLTAVYTVVGGLAAVVVTETIQAVVLIAGAVLITAFAYAKVGGWDQMLTSLQHLNETARLSMLRSPAVEKEFPWFAIFLGYPVLGIWYWCADQTIVQRVLGAKDENHARIGPLFCGDQGFAGVHLRPPRAAVLRHRTQRDH